MRRDLTYFSLFDHWDLQAQWDERLCVWCKRMEQVGIYNGDVLRRWFPYLEILDMNTIAANVHPNCRCLLVRIID